MAIIHQTNKKTGITYVVESKSYWDRDKKQPRSHRTIIGKIDPITGDVVPTKKYNREKKSSSVPKGSSNQSTPANNIDSADQADRIAELERLVAQLRKEKEDLIRDLSNVLKQHNI